MKCTVQVAEQKGWMDMQVIKYVFQRHGDERGQLVALEELKDIPFSIRRVYYMYETGDGVRRGGHAHKSLEQVLICIHGGCRILLDNGKEKKVIDLDKPYEGLYVSNAMWREMFDFTPDAVLMVLASEYYDGQDYIRNYDEFLKSVHKAGTDPADRQAGEGGYHEGYHEREKG